MREYICGDVVPGCNTLFRDRSEDGILRKVALHARTGHGMPQVPDALAQQVRSKIRVIA